jgi:hypothetical protein
MRITPTEYAEEAYQAKLKQHRPMRRGPAGLPLPEATSIFRKTVDGKLLAALVRAAFRATEDADTSRVQVTDYWARRGERVAFNARCGRIVMWPGQFKVRTGRWPRWIEIEREFPVLGDWLKEQRNG